MQLYKKDDWINFKLEYDKVNKTMTVYVNGEEKKVFSKSELEGIKYENIGFVRFFVSKSMGYAGEELLWLDNVKTEKLEKRASVSSVRFNSVDGSSVGSYAVADRKLSGVDVKFSAKVNENTLAAENVKLLYNGEEVDCQIKYDETSSLCTLIPKYIPSADAKVEVLISGVEDESGNPVNAYRSYAIADNSENELDIAEFEFVNEQGEEVDSIENGNVYLKTIIANTTANDRKILVSLMGYKNGAMSEFDYQIGAVGSDTTYMVNEDTNTLCLDASSVDSIRATIQDADSGCALIKDIYLSKTEESAGEISFVNTQKPAEAEAEISLDILTSNAEFGDLATADDFRKVLVYKTQTTAESDGSYKISFNIDYEDAVSGMYVIKAAAENYSYSDKFLYVNPKKAAKVFDEKLKPALAEGNATKVGEVIADNQFDLYIDDEYFDNEISNRVAELLIEHTKKENLTYDNTETIINKVVAISAFEKGKITDILAEAEKFDIESTELKDLYNKSFVDDKTRADISDRLDNTVYRSVEDFYESLCDAFVLAVVENSTEPNSAKKVMNAFGIYGKTAAHYSYVAGKPVKNLVQ